MFDYRFDTKELLRVADAETRGILHGVADAVRENTRALEKDMEGVTRFAVKGKLYRGWQSQAYPKKGPARNPAGNVYFSQSQKRDRGLGRSLGAIKFHSEPGRNRAEDGAWRAIPTPAAGPQGRGRHLTPGDWERRTGKRLRFVYGNRRGLARLVVDDAIASGRRGVAAPATPRRQKRYGEKGKTITIFVLIPYQDHRPAFAIAPVVERRTAIFENSIPDHVRRRLGE